MTPLGREIAAMIAEDGPMSVERFMTLAAMHPQHGYYRSRVPIGAQGDFITAPEIHQMFGELIGLWQLAIAKALKVDDMAGLVMPYPTLSEVSQRAAATVVADHWRRPWTSRLVRLMRAFG